MAVADAERRIQRRQHYRHADVLQTRRYDRQDLAGGETGRYQLRRRRGKGARPVRIDQQGKPAQGLPLARQSMSKSVRRVVTGHDIDGRSTFIIDGPTPHVFSRSKGSAIVHELWETTSTPADNL